MLEGADGAESVYELSRIYWSGSRIISLSNRNVMNIFQLLHGHAQNQMKGTVLTPRKLHFGTSHWMVAKWNFLYYRPRTKIYSTKSNENRLDFLANSQVIRCDQSFSRDTKEFKAFHFLLGFLLPKNRAPWISLFAVQLEILITKTAGGRSNEHLYIGQRDKKMTQVGVLVNLLFPPLPPLPYNLCPDLGQAGER